MSVTVTKWFSALNLSDEEERALRRALGIPDSANGKIETSTEIETLAEIALAEYIDWLTGRHRFTTTSEVDAHRIFRLFHDIRKQPLSVESIANDVSLSPGKAVSIVSRLRYGEGRALARMANDSAIGKIISAKPESVSSGRVTVYLGDSEYDAVMHAAGEIMRGTEEHKKGGRWEGCERPEGHRERYLSRITATPKMWRYIRDFLSRPV